MTQTPNFSRCKAIVLHRADGNTDKLVRQLHLLGLIVEQRWGTLVQQDIPDILLVDADQGWNGLLPWHESGDAACPLVALLGSEAPSRIEWAMQQGAGAILSKPLSASAVYPALVMAHARHEERVRTREEITHLEERLKLRPVVHAAAKILMEQRSLNEDQAHAVLRSTAMRQQKPLETLAAALVTGTIPLPEAG